MSRFLLVLLIIQFPSWIYAYEDMIQVVAGAFYMGDDNSLTDEKPRHTIYISSFYMGKTEVTIARWNAVRDWALNNGYEFSENQKYPIKGPSWYTGHEPTDFPMNNVNWFDCVKWCNARSEFMGRKAVYYTDQSLVEIYRKGEFYINSLSIDTEASGYRMPTEAEWEKAARGGVTNLTHDYPWGYGLSGNFANYKLSGDPFDDWTTPVSYFNGSQQISFSVHSNGGEAKTANDNKNKLGFYDIIGNVSEWCWDWYDPSWYQNPLSKKQDSTGPEYTEEETGIDFTSFGSSEILVDRTNWAKKVHRGGGYKSDPDSDGDVLRTAYRGVEFPDVSLKTIGLRTVRSEKHDALWFDIRPAEFSRWYYLDWYGYFFQSHSTWVFHENFGWIYPVGNGSYDNWLFFNSRRKWLWTSKYAYPWHYDVVGSEWIKDLSPNGEIGWFESHTDGSKSNWGYNN